MGEYDKGRALNFARKYRPQKFSEVVGQEIITRTLKNAIKMGKLGTEIQALLFAGPRGSGKTSIARIVAKSLNCLNLKDGEPCDECSSCIEIKRGSSLDVLEIDGASYRGIQEAKNIIEITKLVPTRNKYKVFIIDEVHMFSKDAFNALLKTLEEPPPRVFFIFATTELYRVPDTIQSRCLLFEFSPLKEELLYERLKEVCKKENINADDSSLKLIAKSSGGSLRDALQLLEKAYYFCEGNIKEEKVREIIGLLPDDVNTQLLELVSEKRGYELLNFLEEVLKSYTERDVLRSFLYFLDDVLEEMEKNIIKKYTRNLSKEDIVRFMQHIFDVQKNIYFIQDPKLLVMHAFYKMIYLPRSIEIEELLDKGSVFTDIINNRNSVKERKVEVVEKEEERKETKEVKKEIKKEDIFFEKLKSIDPFINGVFKERLKIGNNYIEIEINEGFESQLLEEKKEEVEKLIKEVFGSEFKLKLIVREKEKNEIPEILKKFENEFSLSLFKEEENED